jgi:hypothetical protein
MSPLKSSFNYSFGEGDGTPRIVTNGLVLNLDAGRQNSYNGGTTWRDLSGNGNTGTLVNGVGYVGTNGGSLVFDGVNDYVSSFSSQISGTGSKSVNCWFKTTTTVRNGLCGTRPSSGNLGWVFTVNRTSPGDLTYFHTGGTTFEVSAGIQVNTWYNACITYNLTSATSVMYLNGSVIGTLGSFSAINSSSFNGVVGDEQGDFVVPFKGNISQVSIYNGALSAAEIKQNYDVLKGRYGLT